MSTGLAIFTLVHVLLSLIGIVTGLVVTYGFLAAKQLNGWNVWLLAACGKSQPTDDPRVGAWLAAQVR
jgi:hypothetical protein